MSSEPEMPAEGAPDQGAASVRWEELEDAFLFVNAGKAGENSARLAIPSGHIRRESPWTDLWDDAPADPEAPGKTLEIPHKTQLGLGRDLVLWFVEEIIPDRHEEVAEFFQKRGAYAKFKFLLAEEGLLQDWYQFEKTAEEQALRSWCAENGIAILDAPGV